MANELQQYSAYYNRDLAKNMDYRTYMEKQAAVKDITTAIKQNADRTAVYNTMIAGRMTDRIEQSVAGVRQSMVQMQTGIQTSIQAQTFTIIATQNALQRTFQAGFDKVNNTLDVGFAGVSSQLGSMTAAFNTGMARTVDSIKEMSGKICDRLDAIHDIVNNPLLTQSRELYRRSIANYNRGFFEEALEDIKAAVDKNKTDYISWFLLGKVYLFGASEFSNVINLDLAIEAFTTAAKYSKPDISTNDDARHLAAEIYFYLGIAKHSKSNDLMFAGRTDIGPQSLADAQKDYEQSYQLANTMLESLYNVARCKALFSNKAEALHDLETVIKGDRSYCLKAINEGDFYIISDDIYALINRMKKAIYAQTKADFDAIKAKLDDTVFLGGQFADMIKGLVDAWVPETFAEDMPYFDIRDGYEMFPVILSHLNLEQFPPDRLVAELAAEDCPYDDYHKGRKEHSLIVSNNCVSKKLYNNSLVIWKSWTDWDWKYLKQNMTDFPCLLTYQYNNITAKGKIVFSVPTEILKRPSVYTDEYRQFYWSNPKEALQLFDGKIIEMKSDFGSMGSWRFAAKYDSKKSLQEQDLGLINDQFPDLFIQLGTVKIKILDKSDGVSLGMDNVISISYDFLFFLDTKTVIIYPAGKKDPIKVFQPGIASKKEMDAGKKLQEEAEQQRKAEEDRQRQLVKEKLEKEEEKKRDEEVRNQRMREEMEKESKRYTIIGLVAIGVVIFLIIKCVSG
ncbi:hypothetical protein FACS189485_14300 [Spirochaetia bacterium]|nr:hypothetical protein FACS189485_14300 [Spirochaetia bacterium]